MDVNNFGNVYSVYLAYSADKHIRFAASSGGFCKSFLVHLLKSEIIDGAIVTRTGSEQSPLIPETIITSSIEEILSSRTNSVYAPTNPLAIARKLDKEHKYALVGLGCHIRDLVALQKKGMLKNIEIKIGLLCHHVPNLEFTEEVLRKLGIKKEEVRQIEYRGTGWPGGFTAYLNDSTKRFISTDDYWTNNLGNGSGYCRVCSEICGDADIVACDPWNLGLERGERLGKTLIFCRNNRLDSLVNQAYNAGAIRIERCNREILSRSQGRHVLDKLSRK